MAAGESGGERGEDEDPRADRDGSAEAAPIEATGHPVISAPIGSAARFDDWTNPQAGASAGTEEVRGRSPKTSASGSDATARGDALELSPLRPVDGATAGAVLAASTSGDGARVDATSALADARPVSSPPTLQPSLAGPFQAPGAIEPQAAPSHPVASGVPFAAVPIEIGLRSLEGLSRFDIRLSPQDLGGIAISLDIAADGAVNARLVVDRPETLAMLQRDASHLERALEQAGLKTNEASIDLSLRNPAGQGGGAGRGDAGDNAGGRSPGAPSRSPSNDAETSEPTLARSGSWARATGVDLRI